MLHRLIETIIKMKIEILTDLFFSYLWLYDIFCIPKIGQWELRYFIILQF